MPERLKDLASGAESRYIRALFLKTGRSRRAATASPTYARTGPTCRRSPFGPRVQIPARAPFISPIQECSPMREIKLQDLKSKTPTELITFAEELEVENA